MALFIETSSNFEIPPTGVYEAELISVEDLGEEESEYGRRSVIRLKFRTDEVSPVTDEPYEVWRWCTQSLHEMSSLRPIVEALLGRSLRTDEQRRFDIETVIGRRCRLHLVNKLVNGQEKVGIQAVLPPDSSL